MELKNKTAVIDVGGGMRGVYATGIFDYCQDKGISFDLCIGVSAGSANIASFLAGQRKRNYVFYTEYTFRKEYMSLRNFLFKKSYFDLDYVYGTLSNSDGENPLDYQALADNPSEFIVVATDAQTGSAVYFDKSDIKQDDYDIFKASSAIPFVCQPYEINGKPYFDGAGSDTIPLRKALACGCEKIVLILTKPRDFIRTSKTDEFLAKRIRKKYPKAAESFCKRAERYNRVVKLAGEYEAQGRVLIIAPDDTCGVDTLKKDAEALKRLYEKGYNDAGAIDSFIN